MTAPARRAAWIPIALVALIAVLPHLRALGYGFVFDDDHLIVQNAFLHEPWSALRAFGVHFWHGSLFGPLYYRPVVTASLALNGQWLGWGPAGFHAVNLLLHAANAALLVWLLRRLGAGDGAAAFAGALFAVHPVAAWPVGSIVARVDLLPALFVLLAWGAYAASERREAAGATVPAARGWGVAGWFFLALLCKESALAFLAIPILGLRRPAGVAATGAFRRAAVAGGVLAVGLALVLRRLAGVGLSYGLDALSPITNPLAFLPQPERLLAAMALAGRYFLYLFVPVGFADPRDYRAGAGLPGPLDPWVAGTALLLLVWVAAIVIAWLRRDRVAAPLAFALGSFLPASNLLVPIGSLYAQNFLYLPLLGLCVACGGLLGRRALAPPLSPRARGLAWLALPLLGALGIAAARESAIWKDDVSLFEAWTRRFPNYSLAHSALGLARLRLDQRAPAEAAFRRALALDERNVEAQYNLGLQLLTGEGGEAEAEEALAHCRAAAEIKPDLVAARVNAAQALLRLGRPAEAEAEAQKALTMAPGLAPARRNLAEAWFRQDRFAQAATEFGSLSAEFPEDAELRSPYVVSLLRAGDLGAARRAAEEARRDFPAEAWFDFCLARIEARTGNPERALALLRESLAREPETSDWLAKVPEFEPYRDLPGFAAVLPPPSPGP